MRVARHVAIFLLSLALAVAGCQPGPTSSVRFAVSVGQALAFSGSVSRVTVTSSGPGMPSITTELARTSGIWGGLIGNIPAGTNRSFLARAFDSSGTVLFEGSSSGITISPNETTLVAITLQELNPPPPFSNEAPIIQSVVASPTSVQTGGTVSLQASAHDPNTGDTLSYAWTATAGAFSNASSPSTSWSAPATPGLATLTLTVSDAKGASSSVTLTLNVVDGAGEGSALLDIRFNSWPAVSALSASATRLDVGQTTTVSTTASDSDGDSLSYQWAATCAGTWTDGSSHTASFSPSALPSGACNNCQLTVTVSDGRGGQTTGTLALCVATTTPNRFPPTVIRSYQSSPSAQPSQQLTFEVVASDPQDSSLSFSWATNTGTLGAAQNSATSSRIVWTAPACVSASTGASVMATVTNAHGLSATRGFQVTGLPTCPTWASTGSMTSARHLHTATPLGSGKVLVSGGYSGSTYLTTAELYDPATGTWSPTGSMASPRYLHTATPLSSGKVLVVGGYNSSTTLAAAELYDPETGTWSPAGSMASPRHRHTATPLSSGKILVTGGANNSTHLATAELYDPETGTWSPTGSMTSPRSHHTATLLSSGKVLVSGGHAGGAAFVTAELYDPATGTWSPTGSMTSPRYVYAAMPLSSGKVLASGGHTFSVGIEKAELYDPETGSWSSAGSMASPRYWHTMTPLSSGKVLVAGGYYTGYGHSPLMTAELYDPATGTWSTTGSIISGRGYHTATPLNSGRILISGGYNGSTTLATAELYTP